MESPIYRNTAAQQFKLWEKKGCTTLQKNQLILIMAEAIATVPNCLSSSTLNELQEIQEIQLSTAWK